MKRVLVTGGAGYVGFSLVRALARNETLESITVIDNLARRNWALFVSGSHGPVPVAFRRMDILDGHALDTVVSEVDTVFHLAAHASTPLADRDHHVFDQVNNWGTAQVVRSIEKSASVRRVLYLSSFAVYGDSTEPIGPGTEPQPGSTYGMSKLAGEDHVRRLSGPTVHIVRGGNVFGFNPAIRFDAVINALCFDAWTERRVRITGDGSQTRPFIHVQDLADALVQVAQSDMASGTHDLATHNASVSEVVEILQDIIPDVDRLHVSQDSRMQRLHMALPTALGTELGLQSEPLDRHVASLVAALQG